MVILFATGTNGNVLHVPNGFSDVDSNQLTTPEFTVTETGNHMILNLRQHGHFSLNVYILNELQHRLPDRLYYKEVYSPSPGHMTVGYFCNGFPFFLPDFHYSSV